MKMRFEGDRVIVEGVSPETQEAIDMMVAEHESDTCICDLTDSGYGLCMAGQLVEGAITLEDYLREIE